MSERMRALAALEAASPTQVNGHHPATVPPPPAPRPSAPATTVAARLAKATASLAAHRERYRGAPDPLVPGYIWRGQVTIVAGAQESFKSWFTNELDRAVATGGAFLGSITVPRGTVLHYEQERMSNYVYQTDHLQAGWGHELGGITTIEPCGMDFCDPAWQAAITSQVEAARPLLVTINSYRAVFHGRPPDSSDVALALGWLGHLAERVWCAVVLVDAYNKPGAAGRLRGNDALADSGQKAYEADAILHLERDRDKLGRGVGPARVLVGKQRVGITKPSPFVFDVLPWPAGSSSSSHPPGNGCDDDDQRDGVRVLWLDETTIEAGPVTAGPTAVAKARRALADGADHDLAELGQLTGLKLGQLKNALTQLKTSGEAVISRRGVWRSSSSQSSSRDCDDDDDLEDQRDDRL